MNTDEWSDIFVYVFMYPSIWLPAYTFIVACSNV